MKYIKSISVLLIIISLLFNCARRGSPYGGPKDEDAPITIKTIPAFESVNFKENQITIYFDEYVKLVDINKNLIISPPLKYPADILPMGIPSKKITIKLQDTLLANTTYTFNFGESIIDNTEGNILKKFKYIFSTGSYIDSLSIEGKVTESFNKETDKYVSIMLYKADSSFTDSTIYKQKPLYVTNTLDSISWKFTNLKKGKYYLIALKTEQKDFIFRPKSDKIAILDTIISIPTEDSFSLNLFKEILDFNILKPIEISKGHIIFGFEGTPKNLQLLVDLKKTNLDNINSKSFLEKDRDTLHYYFTTDKKTDSLFFDFTNNEYFISKKVVLRKKELDSLKISSQPKGVLSFNDTLTLTTNNPYVSFSKKLFSIVDKDTVAVDFKLQRKGDRELQILFDKKESQNYKIKILPNAIIDFFNLYNKDTLEYRVTTKKKDNYGSITLDMKQTNNKPIIVQLLTLKEKLLHQKFIQKDQKIEFPLLKSDKYLIRVIKDDNNNRIWDTGNYLQKLQPEMVLYFPKEIIVKENWFVNEVFDLGK